MDFLHFNKNKGSGVDKFVHPAAFVAFLFGYFYKNTR